MKLYANYSFFESIDTEEKAYWLGFIYADGSITKNKQHYTLSIHLKTTDEAHVRKFKEAIKAEHKIGHTSSTYRGKTTYGVRIQIRDPKLISDLEKLGVIQNKTYMKKVSFDIVDKSLQRHFIRGYFDGDGSVGKRWVRTTGMIPFSNAFEEYLKEHSIPYNIRIRGAHNNIKDISVNEQLRFLDLIYKDATVYLDRKYEIYKERKH